jgi:hypothetical protein
MAEEARRCIAELDSKRQDITMLWLLREREWLERGKATRELRDWLQNTAKVSLKVAAGDEFQREVRREFSARGVRPVAPSAPSRAGARTRPRTCASTPAGPGPASP